ncbi:MAG: hypothetical protein N2319_04435 [Candidatus Kapabacteria bacterium]|nr:hypothetical protein [Candidatus Kapabacteria bacterium]
MKSYSLIFIFISIIITLFGCKSIDLPTIEQSQKLIDFYQPQINLADRNIDDRTKNLPSGNDFILRLSVNPLNTILKALSNRREDDIKIIFRQSKNVVKEDKSVLGINYTNYINIDTGSFSVNIKAINFSKFDKNIIEGKIEIEGKGAISASGKYIGVPASISPEVQIYLNEPVSFNLEGTDSGYIVLKPRPAKLTLKTKFFFKLLEWKIPWGYDSQLEFADIMKPMAVPIAINTEVQFPKPSKKAGSNQMEQVPYEIQLKNTRLTTIDSKLEFRSDAVFRRK